MPHYPLRTVGGAERAAWPDTRSMLAMDPAVDSVCVFVHGWGGDEISTWAGFPALIRDSLRAEHIDFFFFKYDSRVDTAAFSAALLRKFLQGLLETPATSVVNPSLPGPPAKPRSPTFRYRRLIVCAHSMGAVVARRAILDLESQAPGQFHQLQLQLLLFAPAHKGTDLVELSRELLGGSLFGIPLASLRSAALVKLKSLRDLATGSPTLAALEEDNRAARESLTASGQKDACFRARVFHAKNDSIVRQDDFDADAPFEPVLGHEHTSICKPTPTFKLPFEALEALL